MQTEIDSARNWRGGSYSLVIVFVGIAAGMTVLSATGLSLVFWVEGATVMALLGLNLWRNGRREPAGELPQDDPGAGS
jgi:hypothetical protein